MAVKRINKIRLESAAGKELVVTLKINLSVRFTLDASVNMSHMWEQQELVAKKKWS